MTTIEAYKCDYCGKSFNDAQKCLAHEQDHYRGIIKFWDSRFQLIPVDNDIDILDKVFYIQCVTKEASLMINKWFENVGIYPPYSYAPWEPNDIVYYHNRFDCWISINEQTRELESIRSSCV